MCVGACREKLLCTTFILSPIFDSFCVPESSQNALQTGRPPMSQLVLGGRKEPVSSAAAVTPPLFLSLLSLTSVCLCMKTQSCVSLVRPEVTHCPLVHAPPPPSHFMQLSHSTASSIAAALLLSVVQVENRGV